MIDLHQERIPATVTDGNLQSYEAARQQFSWEQIEAQFSWAATGKVNMAYEAIDRHIEQGRGGKTALIYSDQQREERYTFEDLSKASNRFANGIRKLGIGKGDRVFIFMPRTPELYVSVLGSIKVGAIIGPLFEAFMETAVKDRLQDSGAVAIVTTPALLPRIKRDELPELKHIILFGDEAESSEGVVNYNDVMDGQSDEAEIEWMDREDGMILHYTSGSTGKPKGIYHVHNVMVQQLYTGQIVLDLKEDDVYWCTADPGWVTGTAYGIFAPWLNGVTNVVRGGRFSPADWYSVIEKFGVTVWYSAPTAFRMLMGAGDDVVKQYNLSSLRHVLSVGEPLNPEVVRWGMKVYQQRIHDTWWMTETGAQLICNYPSMDIKPGSMGKPIPGVEATILDDQGNELPPYRMGNLAIRAGWPSMMRKVWNNDAKYAEYFRIEGWYISGDSAYRDEDGYFWFQGRVDDVINTSGERVGPFEVESKLVEHPELLKPVLLASPTRYAVKLLKLSLRFAKVTRHQTSWNKRLSNLSKLACQLTQHRVKLNLKISCRKHAAVKLCAAS